MKSQSRNQAIAVLLLAAVVILIVVTWTRLPKIDNASRATLPDDSKVEFIGSIAGANTFTTETKWQRLVRSYIPIGYFQKLLPAPIVDHPAANSNWLTVYLHLSPTPLPGIASPWQQFTSEDDRGFRFSNQGMHYNMTSASSDTIVAVTLSSFPRRQREFLLDLLDKNGTVIAKVRVPNPVSSPIPFPEWRPEPLPQTKTNGPVIFSIFSIKQGGRESDLFLVSKSSLTTSDPAWRRAKFYSWTVSDSSGNEDSFLSPQEPAWKLRTSIYRENLQDFNADEQIILTNLPAPAPGVSYSIDQYVERLEARNLQAGDKIDLYIRDNLGRESKIAYHDYKVTRDGRLYCQLLKPQEDAKSFTLTIVINHPLSFEFMINPADIGN